MPKKISKGDVIELISINSNFTLIDDHVKRGMDFAKKEFNGIQERDKIKTEYCHENKINYIIIPHWEFCNTE